MAVLATTFADRRRVDDRHHFGNMFPQQPVEQCFVPVLQGAEKNITFDVAVFTLVVFVSTVELVFDSDSVNSSANKAEFILRFPLVLAASRVLRPSIHEALNKYRWLQTGWNFSASLPLRALLFNIGSSHLSSANQPLRDDTKSSRQQLLTLASVRRTHSTKLNLIEHPLTARR